MVRAQPQGAQGRDRTRWGDQPAPVWARCLVFLLAALLIGAAWLFVTLFVTLGSALGENNGTPPEWLYYPVMLIPVAGSLSLMVAAVSAAFARGRTAWAAFCAAAGSLVIWVPLALLLASDWS